MWEGRKCDMVAVSIMSFKKYVLVIRKVKEVTSEAYKTRLPATTHLTGTNVSACGSAVFS